MRNARGYFIQYFGRIPFNANRMAVKLCTVVSAVEMTNIRTSRKKAKKKHHLQAEKKHQMRLN